MHSLTGKLKIIMEALPWGVETFDLCNSCETLNPGGKGEDRERSSHTLWTLIDKLDSERH